MQSDQSIILLAHPACVRLCFCIGAAKTPSLSAYVFVNVTNSLSRFRVPALLKVLIFGALLYLQRPDHVRLNYTSLSEDESDN